MRRSGAGELEGRWCLRHAPPCGRAPPATARPAPCPHAKARPLAPPWRGLVSREGGGGGQVPGPCWPSLPQGAPAARYGSWDGGVGWVPALPAHPSSSSSDSSMAPPASSGLLAAKFSGRRVCRGGNKALGTEKPGGDSGDSATSPPFAPRGSCKKHLELSGSWREPTCLKGSTASRGTPRVVRAREPGVSEHRDRAGAGGAFAPVPWLGTTWPVCKASVG